MTDEVEVWLDSDFLERTRVGTLSHDRGTLRFVYEPERGSRILRPSRSDPDLSLGEGTHFPNAEAGNFRVFDDSAPDRWGQTLMKRREALAAKDEGRKPRTLYAWDFLLGVEDVSRQGALRYRARRGGLSRARRLDRAAGRESQGARGRRTRDHREAHRRSHSAATVAKSPGGPRGVARRCASEGELHRNQWQLMDREVSRRTMTRAMSEPGRHSRSGWRPASGIEVPQSELRRFSGEYHTFCVRRFDRSAARRRFYASAMALLRRIRARGQVTWTSRSSYSRAEPRITSLPISSSSSGEWPSTSRSAIAMIT